MKNQFSIIISVLVLLCLINCSTDQGPVQVDGQSRNLNLISQTQTPGWAEGIWITGDTAFVADGELGVIVWDVSNRQSPALRDTVLMGFYANQVVYSPQTDLLLILDDSKRGGIYASELTTEFRTFTYWSYGLEDFCLQEISPDTFNLAFVDRFEGFRIEQYFYDDEFNFWDRGLYREDLNFEYGSTRGLCLDGEYAYLAHYQWGLDILEIDFMAAVTSLGSVDTPGAACDVALNGAKTHAVVADSYGGLQIIDVVLRTDPKIVGALQPVGLEDVFKVVAVGDTAYFLDRDRGLFAADFSDPATPVLIGQYATSAPSGVFVTDDHLIFLTDVETGLLILEW